MLTKEELAKQRSNNVRFWRTKRGLSQAELANAVGMSKDHCVQVEAGNRGVSLFVLYKIAKVLKVTPDSLLVNNEAQQDIHIKNIVAALNSLELLIRIYCEKETYAEAAKHFGISLSACKSRVRAAKEKLKKHCEK